MNSNSTSVSPAVSTALPVAPATVPTPAAAPESIDLKIAALKAAIETAEQEKVALLKASEEAFTAKVAEIPALLGVASLKEALEVLTAKVMGCVTPPAAAPPRIPTKGHRLATATIKRMKAMLADRETAPYIAGTLGVGLSTVELYKARWGMTRRLPGIPPLKSLSGASHRRSSSNRLAPGQRNQLVAALTANRSSVTRLARRFKVSRQTTYAIRRSYASKLHAAA